MFCFMPGLILLGYADVHRRYLNTLGRNIVPLGAMIIGTIIHYFISVRFVIHWHMGIVGTGVAGVILWGTILII